MPHAHLQRGDQNPSEAADGGTSLHSMAQGALLRVEAISEAERRSEKTRAHHTKYIYVHSGIRGRGPSLTPKSRTRGPHRCLRAAPQPPGSAAALLYLAPKRLCRNYLRCAYSSASGSCNTLARENSPVPGCPAARHFATLPPSRPV